MRISLFIIFVFFSIPVYAVEQYEGFIDRSKSSITLGLKNFDGYLIQNSNTTDANTSFKISTSNNLMKLQAGIKKDGSFVPEITSTGGIKIEMKISNNKITLKKAVMKEGNGNWRNIKNYKINGTNFSDMLIGAYKLYYGKTFKLDTPITQTIKKYFQVLGFNDPGLLNLFGDMKIKTYYRGITCHNNRTSYLMEFVIDNKYSGYAINDVQSGLQHGGVLTLNVMGYSFTEDYAQSYFVGTGSNCSSSTINQSTNNDNSDIKDKLKKLKELLDSGLIAEKQYEDKSSKILENF